MSLFKNHWSAVAIATVALAMSLYHLYVAFFGPPDAQIFRAVHLAFVLVLSFLMLPGYWAKPGPRRPNILDMVLLALAFASAVYPIVYYDYLVNRMYYVDELTTPDFIFGVLAILMILEATRRAVGWALPATAAAFLLYTFLWRGFSLEMVIDQLYLTTEGIFGIPLSVSATYIVLFIIFGALVERSGAGRLFMDFAMSLTGHAAGGPAKVACVTSGLFGSVSGSAVANVMTTGVFTIPLMQRIGYRRGFSGAVEAVASTGGQIMPPIMGAAAFVMAEFLGISYLEVAAFALFPAILYYLALFMAVHFEAKRTGMVGLPRSELPHLWTVLRERGHLFLPLAIIVGVLLAGYSAPLSALAGIVSVVPTALLRSSTRKEIRLDTLSDALISGAKNTVPVALACACAGIVVGTITLTNLGTEFTQLVIMVSQNSLVLALVLTMIAGIILGMGMPTTPAYIVQVALLVPALVKLGVMLEAAHMFVFYYAILSAITPPVAMAVYAANGISRGGLWETGVAALKLGATGYIIPFMFVFGPSILLIGEWPTIATTLITATIGVICLAAGMTGYLITRANAVERILLIIAALVLIKPGLLTDLTGIAILIAVLAWQYVVRRNEPTVSRSAAE
ncbi:TRAP transporter permease [Acuticoccus kandeliae]|uniref:TRAP transporter permease n=1 Tax=Acuticoccus kandeliae TaxID=2073160 RepID=UPI001FE54DD5|nr:TRAP transporter permease [Acuticoccus kandeliae]